MRSIMRPNGVTNWFPVTTPPIRDGRYEVQTPGTCCRCCWEEAEFRCGDWWRGGVGVRVTHWRGLENEVKNEVF